MYHHDENENSPSQKNTLSVVLCCYCCRSGLLCRAVIDGLPLNFVVRSQGAVHLSEAKWVSLFLPKKGKVPSNLRKIATASQGLREHTRMEGLSVPTTMKDANTRLLHLDSSFASPLRSLKDETVMSQSPGFIAWYSFLSVFFVLLLLTCLAYFGYVQWRKRRMQRSQEQQRLDREISRIEANVKIFSEQQEYRRRKCFQKATRSQSVVRALSVCYTTAGAVMTSSAPF